MPPLDYEHYACFLDELYQKVKEIARLEDRSINSQIIYIIRKYIEDYFKMQ